MHFKVSLSVVFFLLLFSFCSSPKRNETNIAKGAEAESLVLPESHMDLLDSILLHKKLVALTNFSPTDYFIYRGQPMGYQYNLVTKFANYLKVDLEMRIEKDLNRSFSLLDSGAVDILTMGLTQTRDRKKHVLFTDPMMLTSQVLVQRKPDGYQNMKTRDEIESHLIKSTLQLAGKTIYVHRGTVFVERLKCLMNEIADTIYIIEDPRETEQLIAAVASKEIDYTIADEHVSLVNAAFYNNIDVQTFISFPQKIGWAVGKHQVRLQQAINEWLAGFNKSLEAGILYNRYFKNLSSLRRVNKSKYNSYGENHLSPYDKFIKKEAKAIGWDWRLLASVIYQESQFKPEATSRFGAKGLMQLMPTTMEKYGITPESPPSKQIEAGAKYLKELEKRLSKTIADSAERIKFTLAAYNTGLGHVYDAQRLAKKFGKNDTIWKNNVDYFILHLSQKKYYNDPVVYYGYVRGKETYNFVEEILNRFEIYKTLIKADKNPDINKSH